jgi:hypothetical protein
MQLIYTLLLYFVGNLSLVCYIHSQIQLVMIQVNLVGINNTSHALLDISAEFHEDIVDISNVDNDNEHLDGLGPICVTKCYVLT